MSTPEDFYSRLGISRTASQEEIQRAYRKLARQYHPDINKDPGAEDTFKAVSEAYDVLSDPETRKKYDDYGPDFRQVPEGVDPETWKRYKAGGATAGAGRGGGYGGQGYGGFGGGGFGGQGFGGGGFGGGGFGGAGGGGQYYYSGDDVDIEDLLGGMFGGRGGGGRRPRGPMPGADQEAELEVTLEEAYRGGRRSFSLSGAGGTRTIDVNIPAGVVPGQRIRLAGQGAEGSEGGEPGDLYLLVRFAEQSRYRVDGRNVTVNLPLSPSEAALGATVSLDIPDGEAKVKVPGGTSSGRKLRLRGRGIPNPKGTPGDLFAEVRIAVPPDPTEEERRLYEQLAATSTFDPRRPR